ncbi:hypothetical protein ACE11G_01895 [Gordonia sp. PS3]|uniref:hypothetical protein n=1 Tax=Gordonia sp. PS3 TaxID=3248841 RepID=UPI0035BFB122
MPDNPARSGASAAAASAGQVRVSGLAVATGASHDRRLGPAHAALGDAGLEVRDVVAVIHVKPPAGDTWSAERVRDELGLGGAPAVRALDVVDDGCGVPSSIAVGSSMLAQTHGAVLVVVAGAAAVLTGTPQPGHRRGDRNGSALRSSADSDGTHAAVERVLTAVGDDLPIVAVAPGGIRLAAGRRFVATSLSTHAAAPIEGLIDARAGGHSEVVLVTANGSGHAAAVVCRLRD